MNRLLAAPIPVPYVDRGEQLEGTGHVGHILQPFQRRMELHRCKLLVPAIGCRKLVGEPPNPGDSPGGKAPVCLGGCR